MPKNIEDAGIDHAADLHDLITKFWGDRDISAIELVGILEWIKLEVFQTYKSVETEANQETKP